MGIDYSRKGAKRRTHKAEFFAPDSKAGAKMRGSIAGILESFTADIKEKALRSAAYAGAKVFYDEMKERTAGIDDSGPEVKKGTLHDAVYHAHVESKSGNGREVYHIGPNKSKAPHWFNVEYGHFRINLLIPVDDDYSGPAKVVLGRDGKKYIATKDRLPAPAFTPPYPYARPTFDSKSQEAVRAMQKRLVERIRELRAAPNDD
jgi:hypothetical protein